MTYSSIYTSDSTAAHLFDLPKESLYISEERLYNELILSTKAYKQSIPYKEGIHKQQLVDGWILPFLLFCFALIAFVKSAYHKRFIMLFRTFFNWKVSGQIIRHEKVYTHPANVALLLNFILTIPLFFSVGFIKSFSTSQNTFQLFLFLLIPLLIYILFKSLLYQFSKWLFDLKNPIEEYLFQTSLFNKYLGVAYLILTTILVYSSFSTSFLILLGIGILFLFLVFQLIRGVIIGIKASIPLYLIILYLCTLEILPWLILGKFIYETSF